MITDYLSEPKHPALISLNKILVCEAPWKEAYDYILFIDADILIHAKAPPLHDADGVRAFGDTIGVVHQSQPTLEARIAGQIHKGYADVTAADYYRLKAGLAIETDHIINSGVLVIQPAKHAAFLRKIFQTYFRGQLDSPHGFHYDQAVVGYELLAARCYTFLDKKLNALWANNKYYYNTMLKQPKTLQEFYDENYFIHLAGRCDYDRIPSLTMC